MPWVAPVIAGGTALAGALTSADGRAKSSAESQKAVQEWLSVHVPDPASQRLILQRYVQTGELDPQIEQAIQRDGTAFDKISLDPSTRERQLKALDTLSELGETGMTPAEEAAQNDARIQVGASDRGRREAIADTMARRGLSGSGVALTEQLAGAQSAQDSQAKASRDVMAQARQRALDSVIAGGRLAGDIRGQDYGMAKDRAGAEDAIGDFNARMTAGVRTRNAAAITDARRFNLERANAVSDKNTALTNEETNWNQIGRYQQQFDNKAKLASGRANAYSGNANTIAGNANANAQMMGNIAGAAGKVATAYATRKSDPAPGYDDYYDDEDSNYAG